MRSPPSCRLGSTVDGARGKGRSDVVQNADMEGSDRAQRPSRHLGTEVADTVMANFGGKFGRSIDSPYAARSAQLGGLKLKLTTLVIQMVPVWRAKMSTTVLE